MFYYKKRNVPEMGSLISYPNMKTLIEMEGISRNTYMYERKVGLIQILYTAVMRKGVFSHYSRSYIRITEEHYHNIDGVHNKLRKRVEKSLNHK